MSKGVRKVIGIAVAIAVPFMAPAIAGSIGLSATVGKIAGSAIVGAGMNAAGAAISGGNVGRAALIGGVTGGVGGYLSGASAAGGTGAGGAGLNTAGAVPGIAPVSPTATLGVAGGGPVVGAGTATAGGGTGFMAALRALPGNVMNTIVGNPAALANITLRAAGMLAGSAIAGDGLSPEERRLVDAQAADLEWLRRTNKQAFDLKMNEALNLIGEAKYFDPEYFGLQSARRQQMAGAEQERAGLRGLTGDRRQAEQRRIRLGTARNTGTAYDSGYGQGVSGRLQTRTAGINAIPMPSQYGNSQAYGQLGNAYQAANTRRDDEAERIGSFFSEFTGPGLVDRTGDEETEEERRRRERGST